MREIVVSLGPLVAFTVLVCGPLASWVARARGRNALLWLVYGTLLGPIGVLLAWLAPQGQCVVCGLPTQGWLTTCSRHGQGLQGDLPVEAETTSEPVVPGLRSIPTTAAAPLARPITRIRETHPSPGGPIVRPKAVPIATPVHDELRILGSGVFSGGSEPLEVGARYAIARLADRAQILGPLGSTPWTVRVDTSLADLIVGTVNDRALLTAPKAPGRRELVLTFQALAGMQGEELEIALTPPVRAEATRQRRRATRLPPPPWRSA